jgi:hypothetical protein
MTAAAKGTYEPAIRNFKLLAHHELNGFGGMGEGMSIQIARDGRRILWLAHESAPKNFTAVDVSDPRAPKVVVQTDLPEGHMRSNSLETVGNIMAVAYQTKKHGQKPAGFELFDISVPETPKSIAFVDASGPGSRGVHQLWFCDGEVVHMAAGAADFTPTNPLDDQFYRAFDVRNPSKPVEVSRWWMPGTRVGDAAPPPKRHSPPRYDMGFRAHNTNVYPQRPDRCYLGYIDGGMFILDISDRANPKPLCRWDNSPPFSGFTHTVLPLFERDLLVVTDEATGDAGLDWPKRLWMVDARLDSNPVMISSMPTPDGFDDLRRAGGRIGAHNIHENEPEPGSAKLLHTVASTWFSAGLRVYDISDPFTPKEIAAFLPETPAGQRGCRISDVFVDDRGILYAADRARGGLYILEYTGQRPLN